MNLNSKFKILAVLSSVLFIVNYLVNAKTVLSTCVLIVSLIVVIGYYVYESSHSFLAKDKMIMKLDKASSEVESDFRKVKEIVNKASANSQDEVDKVDEISGALENTSMMVIRNKENTRQAAQLTQDVIKAIDAGNEEMESMLESISEIKSLSDEIQKIVKVIDDIAFQTNILALNAAVEAARAGDAGKGFAVVADEVRNLAQKSAQAVGSTSKIIEKNITSAENGVNISERVEKALQKMSQEIGKVEELINEITASSEEQATEVLRTKDLAKDLDNIVNANSNSKTNSSSLNGLGDKLSEINECINVLKSDINPENLRELKEDSFKEVKTIKPVSSEYKKEVNFTEKKEVKTFNEVPKAKVEVKPSIAPAKNIVKDDDESNDDFFDAPSAKENDNSSSEDEGGFNVDALRDAQKANGIMPAASVSKRKLAQDEAEKILPLDESDGF